MATRLQTSLDRGILVVNIFLYLATGRTSLVRARGGLLPVHDHSPVSVGDLLQVNGKQVTMLQDQECVVYR